MNITGTRLCKMLEFYKKIDNFTKIHANQFSLEISDIKNTCLQVFHLLLSIYLIINPTRLIISLIEFEHLSTGNVFTYIYMICYRCFIAVTCLYKFFRNPVITELIEIFYELNIDEEDKRFYDSKVLFSWIPLYIYLAFNIAYSIILDCFITLFSEDSWRFNTYPFQNNNINARLYLIIDTVFTSIPFLYMMLDTYIHFITALTLIYQFNKVAKETQRYIREKQSDITFLFKRQREITEIIRTHDSLSTILILLNESLNLISGFIVFGSHQQLYSNLRINKRFLLKQPVRICFHFIVSSSTLSPLDFTALGRSSFKQIGKFYKTDNS